MTDVTRLPEGLPEPVDDGACDHLPGLELPDVALESHDGVVRPLGGWSSRYLVLFVYPRTGGPDVQIPDDWDLIPGARGCTPQGCAFRDHHADLQAFDATVWGMSAQPLAEQQDFAARMHIPFPLLNDAGLRLAAAPLRLPTFTAGGLTLYKRVTLVAEDRHITKVFYPVFPPDRNATDVIDHLASVR
jgi:peroxiredoxin